MKLKRPMHGITRIEQPSKCNLGWYVRITENGKTYQKYFPDKKCGSKNKALLAAKAHRNMILEGCPISLKRAQTAPRKNWPQSKVKGVTYIVVKVNHPPIKGGNPTRQYRYWQAMWLEGDVRKTRKFAVSRYGEKTQKIAETYSRKLHKDGREAADRYAASMQKKALA